MTRRRFLGCAAGAMAAVLPCVVRPRGPGLVLLDLKEYAGLGEALAGYESALATRFTRAVPGAVSRCALLIVPAALEMAPPVLRTIASCLDAGASVLLESAAGFAALPEFRAYRAALHDALQLDVEAPVDLWAPRDRTPAQARLDGLPYVDYTWPSPARVRDFSRVVPLGRQAGEIIGRAAGLPVALKRRSGRGTLIYLGSPLGPGLWAGEVEARRWLGDVLAAS